MFYHHNKFKLSIIQQQEGNLSEKSKSIMTNFQKIMANNKKWSEEHLKVDPQYFKKHLQSQKPKYLWIGCSDSRIPAQTVLGLKPGQIFVHTNIANQVALSDINTLSVIQYAVEVLEVTDIIVAGHYECGGVKAAFSKQDHGGLQAWLAHIRDIRIRFKDKFIGTQKENQNLLAELNVKSQVYDIAKLPSVQKAWVTGKRLQIHGLIYQIEKGRLKDLGLTLNKLDMIPEEFWIYDNKMVQELSFAFKKVLFITQQASKGLLQKLPQ